MRRALRRRGREWRSARRTLRKASTWVNLSVVGLQFPVAIVLGYLWGRWLDRTLGTWPWLTCLFTLFGIAAGFVNLFRMRRARGRAGGEEGGPPAAESRPPGRDSERRSRGSSRPVAVAVLGGAPGAGARAGRAARARSVAGALSLTGLGRWLSSTSAGSRLGAARGPARPAARSTGWSALRFAATLLLLGGRGGCASVGAAGRLRGRGGGLLGPGGGVVVEGIRWGRDEGG